MTFQPSERERRLPAIGARVRARIRIRVRVCACVRVCIGRALVLSASVVSFGCERHEPPSGDSPPSRLVRVTPDDRLSSASASKRIGSLGPSQSAKPQGAAPNQLRRAAREETWVFHGTPYGVLHAVAYIPKHTIGQRFPVLVALHGRAESAKGSERGARGWIEDYWLPRAFQRLSAPPLTPLDFEAMVDPKRLASLNAALKQQAFQGVIVVCPYTPDILEGRRPFSAADPFGTFIVKTLLPKVYAETPAIGTPETTGIDGVSLGGRAALLVGLEHARAFGAVGGLQAAFNVEDGAELARRALRAREQNPHLKLRLLSSDQDFFLEATRAISRAFDKAGVQHQLTIVSGTHSYEFNRGPGAFELLWYHDRALRGLTTY